MQIQQYCKRIENKKFRLFVLLLRYARFRFRPRSSFSPQPNSSLFHNSIRYRRIFDIIELLRKSIIELRMKSLCKQFGD